MRGYGVSTVKCEIIEGDSAIKATLLVVYVLDTALPSQWRTSSSVVRRQHAALV